MTPPILDNSPQKEGRILLAISALNKNQFQSERRAAAVFRVPRATLRDRMRGRVKKQGNRNVNRKIRDSEEQALIEWI